MRQTNRKFFNALREKCSQMEITKLVTFHVREHKKFMLKAQKKSDCDMTKSHSVAWINSD